MVFNYLLRTPEDHENEKSFPGSTPTLKLTVSEANQVDLVKRGPEQEQVRAIVGMQYYLPHIDLVSTKMKGILEEAVEEQARTREDLKSVLEKMDEVEKVIVALRSSAEEEDSAQIRRVQQLVSFDYSSRCPNGVKLLSAFFFLSTAAFEDSPGREGLLRPKRSRSWDPPEMSGQHYQDRDWLYLQLASFEAG